MDENGLSNIISALINRGDGNMNMGGGGGWMMWLLVFLFMFGGFGLNGRGVNPPAPPAAVATQGDIFGSTAWQTTQNSIEHVGEDVQRNAASISTLGYNTLEQSANIREAIGTSDYRALEQTNGINQNISQQGADSRLQACNNTNTITKGLAELGYAIGMGQKEISREIEQSRFDSAKQACDITTTDTANTQKVLDAICDLKSDMQATRIQEQAAQIAYLQGQVANQGLAQTIINSLRSNGCGNNGYVNNGFGFQS